MNRSAESESTDQGQDVKVRYAGLIAGFLLLLLTQLVEPPESMNPQAWSALGMMLLMATWWATEAIPIPATSLLPIGLSVIAMMERGNSEKASQRYATALLLAIAYSASIGGVATLIGTPPNALLAAYLSESQGVSIGFSQWMLIGLPVTVVMLFLSWWWLTRKPFDLQSDSGSDTLIRDQLAELGSVSRGEKLVAVVFLLTAAAWMFRPLLSGGLVPWLNDTSIAIAAAIALFLIPVSLADRTFVLDWQSAEKLPRGAGSLVCGSCRTGGELRFHDAGCNAPNAIVFSSGHVRIGDMIRTGFALNLIGVVVVTGFSYLLVGLVFSAG